MTERERKRESTREERQAERETEKQAGSLLSREPNVRLEPRALRSSPEPKADAELTEPPRHPKPLPFNKR